MSRHGLEWSGQVAKFLDAYLGEGTHAIWHRDSSRIWWNGSETDLGKLAARRRRKTDESVFYIPAQRVLALRDGWPRPFSDYTPGDPFVVRDFSEKLRWLKQWLAHSAPSLEAMPGEFIWVASGGSSFNARSPQAKTLAQEGLPIVGRVFQIPR